MGNYFHRIDKRQTILDKFEKSRLLKSIMRPI